MKAVPFIVSRTDSRTLEDYTLHISLLFKALKSLNYVKITQLKITKKLKKTTF